MKKIIFSLIISSFSLPALAQGTAVPASVVMSAAYKLAAKENKKVLLIYHASWCGWCRKMDSCLNDVSCKKFFDDNFITTHLTIQESNEKKYLENPGAQAMYDKQCGEPQGVPFWVILDAKGNLLFDSKIRSNSATGAAKAENMGCPASEKEVNAFIGILRQTTHLNDDQLQIIFKRFRQNESSH